MYAQISLACALCTAMVTEGDITPVYSNEYNISGKGNSISEVFFDSMGSIANNITIL